MDASDIVRLLNSKHYAPADLDEVKQLCRNFPEFSAAHILKVRIMEALGYEKQTQLKVAAVYSMDRGKLLQLVTELRQFPEPETETEAVAETTEPIQFAENINQQADIIIEQHAPYAHREMDSDLLELEDEPTEEAMELLDEEIGTDSEEELLLSSLEKSETEMEEPDTSTEVEIPAIDRVERFKEKDNNHLITKFIKGDPGPIRADQETSLKGDVSLDSIREHDGFITDTLARIYVKQGLFAKAIYAYERLSLKYPEKSAYFAAQIEKIRNINHS